MATNIGPRIQIDGYAEFKKNMDNIIQQQKTLAAEEKATAAAFDKNTSAMEKNKKRAEELKKQIELQKQRIDELKKGVEMSTQTTGENSTQTLKWKEALANAETQLANLETQLKSASGEGMTFAEKMEQAAGKLGTIGEKSKEIGTSLSKYVTGPLAAMGGASVKMASDFEDSMAKVATIANTTEVPLEALREQIKELSDQTGVSVNDIADSVYNAISAGQDTADAVNFVEQALRLSRAGFADTAAATDILTTALNAYGLEASEVNRISDVLITTQNLGKTTVGELSSAMGRVIPTAKQQGVEIEDLAAMYAVMTSNGIATAETTTYLSSMLNELGKSGSKAEKAFRAGTESFKAGGLSMAEAMKMGMSLDEVLDILGQQAELSGTSISNLFGSAEAGKAATVLLDNTTQLQEAMEAMGASTGATTEAYKKLNTKSYEAQVALNRLKNTGIELGTTMLQMLQPAIQSVGGWVTKLSGWVSGLDEGQKRTIITIGGVIAAIGPALVIFGKMATGISNIITVATALSGLLSGPVVLGIGAAIAAGVLIISNWDTIKQKGYDLFASIRQTFENIKSTISTAISTAKSTVETAVAGIKNAFRFDWTLPKIKLPHFRVSGSFGWSWSGGLRMPSVSVDWYKKAYSQPVLFNSPTVIPTASGLKGFGDGAGGELVVGMNALTQALTDAVRNAGATAPTINVYGAPGQDVHELAEEIGQIIYDNAMMKGAVFG